MISFAAMGALGEFNSGSSCTACLAYEAAL